MRTTITSWRVVRRRSAAKSSTAGWASSVMIVIRVEREVTRKARSSSQALSGPGAPAVVPCWMVRSSSSRWPSLERAGSCRGRPSLPPTRPIRSPFCWARKQISPAAITAASRLEVPSAAVAAMPAEVSATIERCRTRSSLNCRISGSPERAVAFQSMSEILSPGW